MTESQSKTIREASDVADENTFGRILEESLNEIFIFDAETLRFLRVNRGARENIGYSMPELEQLTPLDIKPDHTQESFAKIVAPLRNGEREKVVFETIHRRKDGTDYTVEIHLQLAHYQGRPSFVAIILDTTLQKQRQQALLEGESRLRAILNTAVEGIITIDDRGTIESINPAAEALFGYTAAELTNRNVNVLMPSPYHEQHDTYLANYRQTGEKKIIGIGREVVGKRKDGKEFPAELAVSEFRLRGKLMFTGFVRDLTARKRSEEIAQSFGRILEDSLNEIYICAADTLKFLQVNRGARENIGYTMDELHELTPADIVVGSPHDLLSPLLNGTQSYVVVESKHRRKDGSQYDVEAHIQLNTYQGQSAFVAIVVDTSERKLTERELRRQGQALDTGATAIAFASLDGELTYVNDAFLRMWGYERKVELLGRSISDVSSTPEDAAEVIRGLQARGEWIGERLAKRKDGSQFEMQISASMVMDESDEPIAMMASFVDLSELKRVEEALSRLNNELEQRVELRTRELQAAQEQLVVREKLATLGQLAGGVAHEIRNPLGVIRNAVYYLQQVYGDGDEDLQDVLGEITRGLNNSERIVGELLDYARRPTADLSLFPLDEAISSALEMVKIKDSISVVVPVASAVHVHADRGQIERLLANLIQNAVQAMSEGGVLTLACSVYDGQVMTKISDTGTGIAKEELEKIFEPLFTKRAKGIGLGLPLCVRYAEQNHGTLTVESEPGRGATFTLSLPAVTDHGGLP